MQQRDESRQGGDRPVTLLTQFRPPPIMAPLCSARNSVSSATCAHESPLVFALERGSDGSLIRNLTAYAKRSFTVVVSAHVRPPQADILGARNGLSSPKKGCSRVKMLPFPPR